MKLSKSERERVRMMFGGFCAYCGCALGEKGWSPDHVKPVVRYTRYGALNEEGRYVRHEKPVRVFGRPENDHAANLFPSCRACNINKSSSSLEQWRKFLMEGPESLASYNGRFKHMLRFKIVIVNPEPFLFWYEKYNARSSAAQGRDTEARRA